MTLRLIYRSYGGENRKGRPAWYDKRVAMLSFIRAASVVPAQIVWINDGLLRPDIRALQAKAGGIVTTLPYRGMRASYRHALALPARYGWHGDDVVWFSEDDYLYTPDAFRNLIVAARVMPADYFALYGTPPSRDPQIEVPPGWREPGTWNIYGTEWHRILSTTSTFGGRVHAIHTDRRIFQLCMLPHRHMLRDHDTCVALQGLPPHDYRDLARGLVRRGGRTIPRWARDTAITPFLAATNLRARRNPSRARLFYGAWPNLATHLETAHLAPGTEWADLAAETAWWGAAVLDTDLPEWIETR